MDTRTLGELSDQALLRSLHTVRAHDSVTTAAFVARIAEFDARKLYLEAAYSSMHAFCLGELHLSEEEAFRRIGAGRITRRFPVLLAALADGRLSLTAIGLLTPYVTECNVDEWVALATHATNARIRQLVAERHPQLSLHSSLIPQTQLGPDQVTIAQVEPEIVEATQLMTTPVAPAPVVPPAPARQFLHFAIDPETQELLRYARQLLGHQVPSGDVEQVFRRSLLTLVAHLEKQKFGATDRPRRRKVSSEPGSRYVPVGVRGAVWERDGGQCTFVSAEGRRCDSGKMLEFDHVDPFARGGKATVEGIRLRCRAHNQYEAEKTFGRDFMEHKRRMAKQKAAEKAQPVDPDKDVIPWLRALKCSPEEARRAAALCDSMPESATLEERIKVALRAFGPRTLPQMPRAPG